MIRMFSIPANTGWIKHAHRILDLICQWKQNRMAIGKMKNLFFLGVLKLKVKDAFIERNTNIIKMNSKNLQKLISKTYSRDVISQCK